MTLLDRRSYLEGTLAISGGAALCGPGARTAAAQEPEPGTTVWEHSLGEGGDATFHAVAAATGGDYYVFVGERQHGESGEPYAWLVVVSREGEVLHVREEPESQPNPASFRDVVPLGDGTFYVVGRAADEAGSHPMAARFTPAPDGGVEFHWRDVPEVQGVSRAAAVTPDDGVLVVGAEADPETGRDVGRLVKFSANGDREWSQSVNPDGVDVVLTDVVAEGVDGVGVSGVGRADDGARHGVAGTVAPGGESMDVRPIDGPDGHRETVFRSVLAIPNGQGSLALVGEAVDGNGQSAAYIAVVDENAAKTREHFPPTDGSESGFHGAVRRDGRGETVYLGYRTIDGNRDGWITVFDDEGTHVVELGGGGAGEDVFTGAVVTDLLVLAGRYQDEPSEYDGWVHAIVPGRGSTGGAEGGDGPNGGGEGGADERRRGFISNDGGDPEFLSDAFNLTTIGFLLSVVGIAHQMLKGR